MDREAGGSRRRAEVVVVRRERKSVEVLPSQQRARQVNGVQRAQGRRKGLGGTLQHDRVQRDQAEGVDRLENIGSIVRDLPIIDTEANPGPIDRAEAFEPDQLA